MIFNLADNYQFTTSLNLVDDPIEVVKKHKLLGLIISDDLKWDDNTDYLVKRAYARLEILRKMSSLITSVQDMKIIYIQYVRSILEQSCVVWHSSITVENSLDIELVQRCAVRIILGKNYTTYEESLQKIDLESLETRRARLCNKFAKNCLQNDKTKNMFALNLKKHNMKSRTGDKFKVTFARRDRLKDSSIIYMQKELNKSELIQKGNLADFRFLFILCSFVCNL